MKLIYKTALTVIREFALIFIVLLMGGGFFLIGLFGEEIYHGYEYQYVGNPRDTFLDGNISVEKETHDLINRKKGILIDTRVLGVKEHNNKIYSLSESKFSVYDYSDDSQKVLLGEAITNQEDMHNLQKIALQKRLREIKHIEILNSYSDFTIQDQEVFEKLLCNSKGNSIYKKPYYKGPYSSVLYDVEKMFVVTYIKGFAVINEKMYIRTPTGFIIINLDENSIFEFVNEEDLNRLDQNNILLKKNIYREGYRKLESIDEFEKQDLMKLNTL